MNPTFMEAESEGGRGEENGAERARKKQMVWDPVRGLLSRERLEREQERFVLIVIFPASIAR